MFFLSCAVLFAEADNGKWLPSLKTPFDYTNIYIQVEPARLQMPMYFFSQGVFPMTSLGYGAAFEAGYNWDGWLLGVRWNGAWFGKGETAAALVNSFSHTSFSAQISKILAKPLFDFFPKYLEIVPSIGFGADILTADYYRSRRAKDVGLNKIIRFGQVAVFSMNFGIHADLNFAFDQFIPYIGFDSTLFFDKGYEYNLPGYSNIAGDGSGFFYSFVIGVRMYLFKGRKKPRALLAEEKISRPPPRVYKEPEKQEEPKEPVIAEIPVPSKPEISTSALPRPFTPDGDGIEDNAEISTFAVIPDTAKTWTIQIYDPQNEPFKKFSGTGAPPEKLLWDGKSDSGEGAQSRYTYPYTVTVLGEKGALHSASADIQTGLLVIVEPPDTIRIVVSNIFFDPDAATFNKIPEAQRKSNIETLDSVAAQIGKYPGYNITVEGHANNVSNTERENIEELIPLSFKRAERIKQELISRGIDTERIVTAGEGGNRPLTAWENRAQWWKNRRIEFILRKPQER